MAEIEVYIRPLELGDAEGVQRYASDKRVAETTSIPHPYPEKGGEGFVKGGVEAWEKREAFLFAIIADDEMIGVIGLNKADFEKRTVQVDYAIASSHWGKGIMTRVVSMALDYAFKELEMETVHSGCLERNLGSRRVLEKNGFSKVDERVLTLQKFEGELSYRFRLTKEAWKQFHSATSE